MTEETSPPPSSLSPLSSSFGDDSNSSSSSSSIKDGVPDWTSETVHLDFCIRLPPSCNKRQAEVKEGGGGGGESICNDHCQDAAALTRDSDGGDDDDEEEEEEEADQVTRELSMIFGQLGEGGGGNKLRQIKMLDRLPEPTSSDHGPDVLYRIGRSDVVGRFMVADRDISPGEVIFRDQPACIGPDNSSKPMCLGCHRRVDGSYKCVSCRWPMCGKQCSKLPVHVAECAILRLRGAAVTVPWFDRPCAYYDAILPIRVLLLRMSNPKVYRLVTLLMDHNDTLEAAQRRQRQRVVDFIRVTCRLGRDFSEEEVHHVLGILSVNSFVVHDTDEDNMDLIGLYPWTSLMSHSCVPNTRIATSEDFGYVCQAATRIPEGAEIVTSYHHYHYQFYGTLYRRRDLRATWSFTCACRRCRDPTELGTLVSAVRCERCRVGHCLPCRDGEEVGGVGEAQEWCCGSCGARASGQGVREKVDRFETELDAIPTDGPDAGADRTERLLRRMRLSLHENHYWALEAKRRLVDTYGKKTGMELYKLPMECVERKIDYCEHLLEVASVLCPGGSEMRGYLLWEAHGARMRVTQWRWTRMRISTPQYLRKLAEMAKDLREVVAILGPIRADSDEGAMGARARTELKSVEKLISELSSISTVTKAYAASNAAAEDGGGGVRGGYGGRVYGFSPRGISSSLRDGVGGGRKVGLEDGGGRRRSICL